MSTPTPSLRLVRAILEVASTAAFAAVLRVTVGAVLLSLAVLALAPDAVALQASGPVSGGVHGRPFTAATFDLAPYGYLEEEYVLGGTARSYDAVAGTTLGVEGAWRLEPAGTDFVHTRMLVRRPVDASHFNGTVLVEWLNVTGGWDIDAVWIQVRDEILREGYAWVGVSAQRAGVNGPPAIAGVSQPLVQWDPGRYAGLDIPDDALSYDTFTQAAALLGRSRPHEPREPDPLGGLPVERVVAIGASQSAHRLASYVNGVQPLTRAFDGFLLVGRFGSGAKINPQLAPPDLFFLREDLDVPVFVVNTETEALASYPVRQRDTDHYRFWEIAGAAHQDFYVDATINDQIMRDFGLTLPPCDPPANEMPAHYVMIAALHHLDRWVASGQRNLQRDVQQPLASGDRRSVVRRSPVTPPRLDPIAIAGDPPAIQRDQNGNALGGVRLPQLEVPTAEYGGVGTPALLGCNLRGSTVPFDATKLAALYPDRRSYLRRVSGATFAARLAGYLLLPEAIETRQSAATQTID